MKNGSLPLRLWAGHGCTGPRCLWKAEPNSGDGGWLSSTIVKAFRWRKKVILRLSNKQFRQNKAYKHSQYIDQSFLGLRLNIYSCRKNHSLHLFALDWSAGPRGVLNHIVQWRFETMKLFHIVLAGGRTTWKGINRMHYQYLHLALHSLSLPSLSDI